MLLGRYWQIAMLAPGRLAAGEQTYAWHLMKSSQKQLAMVAVVVNVN
jgi:hypothetical protein